MKVKVWSLVCLWIMFCTNDAFTADRIGYVCNEEDQSILPLDLSKNNAGTPISIGAHPFFIAITPDGLTAYATCPFDGQVVPIDLVTNTPEAPIELMSSENSPSTFPIKGLSERYEREPSAQSSGPAGIAITPDGSTAYIANVYDNSVIAINLKTKTPFATIPVGNAPFSIAITPNGRTAYVVNNKSNDVIPIDISTNAPGMAIPVGKAPISIAMAPDGQTCYVANMESDDVTPIDIATNTPKTAIPVGSKPLFIAIAPNGQVAYVANGSDDSVTPIDLANHQPKRPILVGKGPAAVAISPDNHTAYVTNEFANIISIVDIASNKIEAIAIAVGKSPLAMAIVPDQAPVASFSFSQKDPWPFADFSASASYSPVGKIVNYKWDFGDGHVEETADPFNSYLYKTKGNHTVTLTVTNSAGTSTKCVFTGQTMSQNGGPSAVFTKTIDVK